MQLPTAPTQPQSPRGARDSLQHLLGFLPSELHEWIDTEGQPAYRAAQILDWVYNKEAQSFEEMSNLPAVLRQRLGTRARIYTGEAHARRGSDDPTEKLLVTWPDNASIECVWIPEEDRDTACVSSQVGCPVGCRFCASGLDGVERNLTAGEIVEQALWIRRQIRTGRRDPKARLTNIVFMGMGEPLANYDNVVRAIRILNAPEALGLGARRITVSTVGLPAQIRKLAAEQFQINLALSLHAPTDELRQALIPWGKVPIRELMDACRFYFDRTGREITLEYILLDGVNMDASLAAELARLARSLRCNVNLLRYNPVPGAPFARPSADSGLQFQNRLRDLGVNAHMRRSRGSQIDAACGQLRRQVKQPAADEA